MINTTTLRRLAEILLLFSLPYITPALAQSPDYQFIRTQDAVRDKGFYLLTLFDALPAARSAA